MKPHKLAKQFESKIKDTVANKFSVAPEELLPLFKDASGVYLSKEEPDTLCCLVLGQANGFLYLVTAKIENGGQRLNNFKSDIMS